MKPILGILMISLLLSACGTIQNKVVRSPAAKIPPLIEPSVQPVFPLPGDGQSQIDTVYIESSELLTLESFPLQFSLVLKGYLPDPCHRLNYSVNPPDENNKIFIEVYSIAVSSNACIQGLDPFETSIPLGSYPSDHYTIYINNKLIGEFDS